MKVLHVLNEIRYSGAEIMLNTAAPYFLKDELELHVVGVGEEIGEYAAVLEKNGYKVHFIEFQRPGLKSTVKDSLQLLKNFYYFLKNGKYDIVHIHRESAFSLFAIVARMAGVPGVFRTVHNVFLVFQGNLRLRKKIERHFVKNFFKVKFLTIGASVSEVEKEVYGLETTVIPNWTENKAFTPGTAEEKLKKRKSLGIKENSLVIISVGRTTIEKNHTDIIESIPEIIKEVPNLFYIHVGDGPEQEKLIMRTKDLNIENYVSFLGKRNDVRELVVASDIFVMPSKYEGLPISLLEALFCGLPSIIYNNYGVKDLVINDFNGFVVEEPRENFKNAIIKLSKDESLQKKMGENAISLANEQFDIEKSISKLISVYRDAL
ncbi:glycosyltransferase family 4 protein [Flexithrix dorotheae]|uniref:glycosyltransferase family 4 protein n=1 Tax=Flexithrix dorotheae TaxID=70993 RepID=UPI00038016DC|nr:glycosyltransferase family 4 protein [Flexithrix dorotheae]